MMDRTRLYLCLLVWLTFVGGACSVSGSTATNKLSTINMGRYQIAGKNATYHKINSSTVKVSFENGCFFTKGGWLEADAKSIVVIDVVGAKADFPKSADFVGDTSVVFHYPKEKIDIRLTADHAFIDGIKLTIKLEGHLTITKLWQDHQGKPQTETRNYSLPSRTVLLLKNKSVAGWQDVYGSDAENGSPSGKSTEE